VEGSCDARGFSSPKGPRQRRQYFAAAALIFVVTRLLAGASVQRPVTDLKRYFSYAVQGGLTPYQDFAMEYPPLAYWAIAAPRYLSSHSVVESRAPHAAEPSVVSARSLAAPLASDATTAPLLTQASAEREYLHYARTYRGLLLLVDVACAILFFLLAARRTESVRETVKIFSLYAISTFLLAHVLYDRLDLLLSFFVLGSLWCWYRGTERNAPAYSFAAIALAALGVSTKLITGFMIPCYLLSLFRLRPRREFYVAFLVALAVTGLPFLFQYASSGAGTFSFLKYHASRGTQIESIYSSLQALISFFGLPVTLDFSHGSTNLASALSPSLTRASTYVLFLGMFGLGAAALKKLRSPRDGADFAGVAVLLALLTSKVL